MKLILTGFKCYDSNESKTVEFSQGNLTLLKGPTGIGKSTLFQAITWALYGIPRNVDNNVNKKSKLSVSLEMNGILIYRQKRPGLLTVTIKSTQTEHYEDLAAQQKIDALFGDSSLWSAISYLGQSLRCSLLSGSNNDKMDLLNNLAFNSENPELYISKIEKEHSSVDVEFTCIQDEYNKEIAEFNKWIQKYSEDIALAKENVKSKEELQTELISVSKSLEELRKKQLVQEHHRGTLRSLTESLKNTESRITSVGTLDTEQNEEIPLRTKLLENKELVNALIESSKEELVRTSFDKEQLSLENDIQTINNEIGKYSQRLTQIPKRSLGGTKYSQNDLQKALSHEYHRNSFVSKSATLGIEYSSNSIELEKERISLIIANHEKRMTALRVKQEQHDIYQKYQALQQDLLKYPVVEDPSESHIKELQDQLRFSETTQNILKCPHCSKPVRIFGSRITPETQDPVSQEEIVSINNHIKDLRDKKQLFVARKNVENRLEAFKNANQKILDNYSLTEGSGSNNEELSSPPLIQQQLSEIKQRFSTLQTLMIINPLEISSDVIKNEICHDEINLSIDKMNTILSEKTQKLSGVLSKIKSLGPRNNSDSGGVSAITSINKQIEQLQVTLENVIRKRSILTELHRSREQLQQQIKETSEGIGSSYEEPIKSLSDQERKINRLITSTVTLENAKNTQLKLQSANQKINEKYNYLKNLSLMKTLAIDVECETLQRTVDTINTTLANICTSLFEDPISVTLQLYKTSKSTSRVKPTVNLLISYKGGEFDNINHLSGGEGDRISLALTLALSRLGGCPILLLDESLSSLDANMKEICLKVLRENSFGKTIICINHEGTEGYYDSVISLG